MHLSPFAILWSLIFWTSWIPTGVNCINLYSFQTISFQLDGGQNQVFHVPSIPSYTGVLQLEYEWSGITGFQVFAEANILPAPGRSEPLPNGAIQVAAGTTDSSEWYCLVQAPPGTAQQGNMTVAVIKTDELQSGKSSLPLTMRAGQLQLFHLAGGDGASGIISVTVREFTNVKLFLSSTTIPSLGSVPIPYFPYWVNSAGVDNVDWYLLLQATDDIDQAYVVLTTTATIQIDSGVQQQIPSLVNHQQMLYKYEASNYGGIITVEVSDPSSVNLYVNPRKIGTTNVMRAPQVTFFAEQDSFPWYFLAEPNNMNITPPVTFTMVSIVTQYVTSGTPFPLNMGQGQYLLLNVPTNAMVSNLLHISVSGDVSHLNGSVNAGSISSTLIRMQDSLFISPSESINDWWIVLYAENNVQNAQITFTTIDTQIATSGSVNEVSVPAAGNRVLYKMPSNEFNGLISLSCNATLSIQVYCSAWANQGWIAAPDGSWFTSQSNENAVWWFLVTPKDKGYFTINSYEPLKIISETPLPIVPNQTPYTLYHMEASPNYGGVIEIKKDIKTKLLVSQSKVPSLSDSYYNASDTYQLSTNTDGVDWWFILCQPLIVNTTINVTSYPTEAVTKGVSTRVRVNKKTLYKMEPSTLSGMVHTSITGQVEAGVSLYMDQVITTSPTKRVNDQDWVFSDGELNSEWYITAVFKDQAFMNISQVQFTLETVPTVYEFCDPVLLCNGHGVCGSSTEALCHCINGYTGVRCDVAPHKKFLWIIIDFVILIIVTILYKVFTVVRDRMRKKRAAQFKDNEYLSRFRKDVSLKIYEEDAPLLPNLFTIDIEFKNLLLQKGEKTILNRVSGHMRPGRMTAIMGSSGSGKTSLLSVLSGKVNVTSGDIYLNGQKGTIRDYSKLVGFAPQEDIMMRMLTVKENLLFSANARLPSSLSATKKHQIVDGIIELLGLTNVKHSIIGNEEKRGISGGERKRVNIGMELVAEPSVLFCDEPTSGLDSSNTKELVSCLAKIAATGVNVIVVLHQPRYEVFEMFDDICLLSGGRTVYEGPSKSAKQYFEGLGYQCPMNTNPTDWFIDIISGADNKTIVDAWDHSDESKRVVQADLSGANQEKRTRKTANIFKQLYMFTARSLVQQSRDLGGLYLDNLLVFVAGSMLGFSYQNSEYVGPPPVSIIEQCPLFIRPICTLPTDDSYVAQACLTCLALGMTAAASGLKTFGSEKPVYWREASTGTSTLAYYIGKNVASIPAMLLPPLVYLSVFYFVTDCQADFFMMYIVLLCVQFTCVGIGYFIAILLKPANSLIASVVAVVIFTIFAGFNPTLKTLNGYGFVGKALSSVSFARWATESLYILQVQPYNNIYNIDSGLSYWDYKTSDLGRGILYVIVIGIAFRVLALVALYCVNRKKKR